MKTNSALRVETLQSLLFQLGLRHVVVGDDDVVFKVEETAEWVKIALIVPKRPDTPAVNFMERRPRR